MEQLKGSEGTSLQEGDLWVGFEEGQCNIGRAGRRGKCEHGRVRREQGGTGL